MFGEHLTSRQWIDRGGQWVGPTQDRFMALLDEYQIRRFPSPAEGKTVLVYDNKRYEFKGFFQGFPEGEAPGIDEAQWQDAMTAWARFDELSKSLPSGHPQTNEYTKKLDSVTFAQWIDENTTTDFGRWYFKYMSRAVGFLGPAEPSQVSLLHVLWAQNCAGQAEHPEADLIHGGAGQVPHTIATELGDRIRLGEPEFRISYSDSGVTVETNQNAYSARYAIVAMSPNTYTEVDWPADSWTGGAYAAFMPLGVWTSFGEALTAPVGPIYWAGTEMADCWPGFFDGAIRTGEAAAASIATHLAI